MMNSNGSTMNNHGASSSSSSSSFFGSILHFCNTFAVAILACCVVWIFFQLQYVNYQLHAESDRIDNLLAEIQSKQTEQIDELNEKVDSNHSLTLIQMAGTFTLIACLVTVFHMSQHLRNYQEPIVQKRIISILWMCPIYAVTAFLSLLIPSADGYLAVIRDFYEAYTVYNFFSLLLAILGRGNRDVVVNVLAQHAHHLKPPTKCLKAYYHPPPEASDQAMANAVLYECQVLCMQFVFCRPLTSIASFVSTTLMQDRESGNDSDNDDDPLAFFKTPNFYIAMITNVSVFFAFTGLLKFYHAVRDDLLWCQPFSKFMAIKGIVFLTFWQGLLIAIFVSFHEQQKGSDSDSSSNSNGKTPQEQATAIQHILICLEMVFFAIAHLCVFPAEEWEPNYRPKEFQVPSMGISDFARDVKYIVTSSRRQRSKKNDDGDGSNVGLSPINSQDEDDDDNDETMELGLGDEPNERRTDPLSPPSNNVSYQQANTIC
mmetsp:Transcript_23457/g.50842  ORF Transcript_23457/g.50842 Transcript_23457/m.50842 type:complete len:487 (+) Transcript_23457:136-1596(+)